MFGRKVPFNLEIDCSSRCDGCSSENIARGITSGAISGAPQELKDDVDHIRSNATCDGPIMTASSLGKGVCGMKVDIEFVSDKEEVIGRCEMKPDKSELN